MSLAMSRQEREAFLAETRVAVIGIAEEGRGPLTVPVWYHYTPGGPVRFVTDGASKKASLLQRAPRMSLCVQTETPPYKYLSVEGPVTVGTPDFERDVRQMAQRYLGEQMAEIYLAAMAGQGGQSVLVTLSPERWLSVDYAKMGFGA